MILLLSSILFVSGCISQTTASTNYDTSNSNQLIPDIPSENFEPVSEQEVRASPKHPDKVVFRSIEMSSENIFVSLDIRSGDSMYYTLEEIVPADLVILNVSSKECGINSNKISCAYISSKPMEPRTITYLLKKTDNLNYVFRGTYTMNNTDLTLVQGDNELNVQ